MSAVPELVDRTRQFVLDHVIPVEREVVAGGRVTDDALRLDLQKKAKEAGVFGPLSDPSHGGLGLDTRGQAEVLEAAGASLLGPLAVNAWAPDDGNIHLLSHVADTGQRERYLAPLASGEVRSAIAMTEPAPGAGSDPRMLRTVAEETDDGWVINGDKHFTTGAQGAAFVICVAATTDGPTMFLVDQDNPGMRVGRRMPTLDHTSAPGGHCEVRFTDCAVPDSAVLGEVGRGLELAQVRLAPSRLVFCMNWLGLAVRAQQLTVEHITRRSSFGVPVAEHGMAQALVADSEIDIAAARSLVRGTAATIDAHGPSSPQARHEAAITKTFVSEAVWRVLDRAVQLHGGLGVCEDHLVARFLVEARAFRIYEGPSEVLRWSIARRVLRGPR
ncbi:acyl-CoA dehydrogenase family protein [Nocardia otitidiscaviarum]|uniref:acyl-CoA dehydrogenase family protein n=1 Tax=Nocardia otitidiscaviarum TaxID=1823 RepID=UPI0004A6DB62|nr:acyl-CoA dehydrogenase family protein [Nocardia otitidiscaviarum]MBF6134889.1 acyl-CoA dehydrogenase family protein [Nocardia otitidiscaviarum]MBF6485485.1 acyl-CoA dehydrogenase family protein [Nocardia otitidiscaviarum]